MKKVLSIVGARPQFIKLAPLSKELRKHFKEVIVHTGQHYDYEMSRIFFGDLKIPEPDYHLEVGSAPHGKQTAEMLTKLENVLLKEKPDLAIVFGDTNTTLAGAIAASKLGIRLAHIEAGMRSHDRIPEEINRVVADHVSDFFFCSNRIAVENLKAEGITKNVFLVGDIMMDAVMNHAGIAEKVSGVLKRLSLRKKEYVLATVHRAENTDSRKRLASIIKALIDSDEKIMLPLHPRTKKCLKKYSLLEKLDNSNITAIPPIGYFDMLVLEKNAKKIVTDSGGVQKEAYFFNVPCITMRQVTEWKETVKNGFNTLVDANPEKILSAIKNFETSGKSRRLYGKGDASAKIAKILMKIGMGR